MTAIDQEKTIYGLLAERPVSFKPVLARVTGSVNAGLLLSQLLYWWSKRNKKDWIYKTSVEIEQETTLTRREQDTAIKTLKELQVVRTKLAGVPAKRHFQVSLADLYKLVCTFAPNSVGGFVQTNTESTQESTTDNIPATPKKSAKPRSDKQLVFDRIITHCASAQGFEQGFANYGKQTKAIKAMLDASYAEDDITFVIDEMAAEQWWREHPFDLKNVQDQMHRYMHRTVTYAKPKFGGSHV